LHLSASASIQLLRAASFVWQLILTVALFLYQKLLRPLFSFIFYKFVVKSYAIYLSILKKIGWSHLRVNPFSFIFNQKSIHVLILIITVITINNNLFDKKTASGEELGAEMKKTILAEIIKNEFEASNEEGELIVETFSSEAVITPLEQQYLDNLSAYQPQAIVDENGEEITDDQLPISSSGDSLVKQDTAATKISKKPRESTIAYEVKAGDSISTIAFEFDISVNTILWENNLTAYSIIKPGDKLAILPVSGVTHTVTKGESLRSLSSVYEFDEAAFYELNKIAKNQGLKIGQKLLIPGGKKSYTQNGNIARRDVQKYNGLSVIGNLKKIIIPPGSAPILGNMMNWPAAGKRITQYYSWRHTGLDIANKIGTNLYAADSGTVEILGWGRGYGNQILINHGGGKKTRYAHLSKFYVKKGDYVAKGQTIGAMGSTGWSTGSHLHFEVIINGVKYNPLSYIR